MTILCVTTTNLPGVRPCAEFGVHRVTCPDHEGWAERPGQCRGCLPRSADRGFLCQSCYERTVNAVAGWRDFRTALDAAEGRLTSPEAGGGSTPGGYSNLSLVFLTVDECTRHLKSRQDRTVDLWVHDEAGAADAIQFAVTAERAFRDLEVREREPVIVRERCPSCDALTIANSHEERGVTVVTCSFCGVERARIRPDRTRWFGSVTCEHQLHADCSTLACPCHCHVLGAQSRPGGVRALWDADQHTTNPGYRADWTVQDALTIHPTPERTAA